MSVITLDPMVQAVVDATRDMAATDLEQLPLQQALAMVRPAFPAASPPGSEDRTIAGPGGVALRVRLYFPRSQPAPCPVVLYLHGGGFVGGTIEMDDFRCTQLAGDAGCIVASLAYRLAPESPFPAAIEDAFAAWNWINDHATTFGGDAQRGAIYGSSAGGHIAAGATLLARDRGARMPGFQLLANPALDPAMNSQSYREFGNGPFMTRARMAWYWKQYAGAAAASHPLWAPLAADPAGLPPALVITAEYDVLRDEGEAWAARLRSAGIAAQAERCAGMIHGFMTVLPAHQTSIRAMALSAAVLREAFAHQDC